MTIETNLRWFPDDWPDWIPLRVTTVWHNLVCWWYGHAPGPDQCGIPAHDYCGWCQKSMPGEAQ